jgi:hypothetical protein
MKKQLVIVGFALVAGLFSCEKDEIKIPATPLKTTYTIDFEDIALTNKGYMDSIQGGLISKGFAFENTYLFDDYYKYWYFSKGFAVSNIVNVDSAGFNNLFATFAGSGAFNSKNYLLATNNAGIKLPSTAQLVSMEITNATYAALSMKNGDAFAKKFTSNHKDFFKVWIKGYTAGKVKDSLEVYLADFRFTDLSQNYIQKDWKTVSLSIFVNIDSLNFSLESSDNGQWGMNTPGYFTIDNIKFIK